MRDRHQRRVLQEEAIEGRWTVGADSATALAKLLALAGHEVHTAATCLEALSVARQRRCDLLIADIGLPDRTGLELMRELRALYLMPGIVLSGAWGDEIVEQSRAAGFSKYLLKPVIFADVLAAISELLITQTERFPAVLGLAQQKRPF